MPQLLASLPFRGDVTYSLVTDRNVLKEGGFVLVHGFKRFNSVLMKKAQWSSLMVVGVCAKGSSHPEETGSRRSHLPCEVYFCRGCYLLWVPQSPRRVPAADELPQSPTVKDGGEDDRTGAV